MITLRTSTRLTLAVLSVSLGATVALAADKKPSKPAKANAPAVVQKTHTPAITSPRDVASRQATGRTRQPQQFSMQALVTNEQIKRKPTKQLNSGGGVSAQNDAGTRNGTSLALEGMIDMVKGMGKVLSPKGNTHEGLEQTSKGWAKVKTGSNGDPSDN
ncbi:MAG TPA: hypothetical protein PLX97_06705, partial [Gemmatales bacterium]|nr:hypothetical protein [Gemmatales bacterium]